MKLGLKRVGVKQIQKIALLRSWIVYFHKVTKNSASVAVYKSFIRVHHIIQVHWGLEFMSSKLAQTLYSDSIIERSKFWKFQFNSYFCSDFMTFWIFQVCLIFLIVFFQFREAIFRCFQIYKALKDIHLNICSGFYSKQFRTYSFGNMNFFYRYPKIL